MTTRTMRMWIIVVISLILLGIARGAGANSTREGATPPVQGGNGPEASVAVAPLLQYQARLTNPSTGQSVADGSYSVVFSLYSAASGGSPVWTETKSVAVANGLFNTALGDATALSPALFNGQALWLGVKVGSDAESTPRQQILPTAYALSLRPGAVINDSIYSSAILQVNNNDSSTGGGYAISAINYSGDAWRPAIYGENRGASSGVQGRSDGSNAVLGWNQSNGFAGVMGQNVGSGYGVRGDSTAGYGGYFTGGGGAIYAAGSATVAGNLNVQGTLKAPHVQTLSFMANSLNYVPGTIIRQSGNGLLWGASYAQAAFLMLVRPSDWDGTSVVTLKIHFYPTTSTSGNVSFFIRPRAYDPGNTWADSASLDGNAPIPVSQVYIVKEQIFTIPASYFGSKELWVIAIQNQGTGSTYPDDVAMMAVSLLYNATR
jgi:hypothetical protein